MFPSLTFITEESRLKADALVEDGPSVTEIWLHENLQCNKLWPLSHWQKEVLEKRKDAQKDRTYSQSPSRHTKAHSCLPVEAQCVGAGLCPVTAAIGHGAQP